MPLYHDEETIRRVWALKRKHPDWGVRRIGAELGLSKDKVHRILKRIEKCDIEVTEDGRVIDRSKPRGIVALQKGASDAALTQLERQAAELAGKVDALSTRLEPSLVHEEADPLEELLKTSWKIQCNRCGAVFEHEFTDMERSDLIKIGYAYVGCPKCKDYPPGDVFGVFPSQHKIFIRLSDVFRANLIGSKVVQTTS
ncbi:MAG: hypothetical protein ACTSXC_03105 [Candidatus Freyarchaeota archaeon]